MGDDRSTEKLLRQYAEAPTRRLRNEIVEAHMGLAMHIVKRYSNGADSDDLQQVALLGLVRAVERFDPSRGFAFSTFAGRTIEGELKHHFRDHTWGVRVPRSLKDLRVSVRKASDELTNRLGRPPVIREISEFLGVAPESVVEALGAETAYNPRSIDAPAGADHDSSPTIAVADRSAGEAFAFVEDRTLVEELLETLAPRERDIMRMRFRDEMSQQEIADALGISQMQVSRLLRRSLAELRGHIAEP